MRKIRIQNHQDQFQSTLKAIIELEDIDKIDKIMSYAHLLVAEDIIMKRIKFYQQMQEQITNIASSIVFFSLEINEISKNLKNLC